MTEKQVQDLYQRAMKINEEAFAGEEFDIAYHSLMTAIHCAQRLEDGASLQHLAELAWDQLKYIDANRPDYQHSTQSSRTREHASIFETAARQAEARKQIIDRAKRRARGGR